MIHVPGFHSSRPAQERPFSGELLETVLLYNDHDPEDFEDEMWSRWRMMLEPYQGHIESAGARMFDHAVDAVLRNPKRKDKLKVHIETHSIYALANVDPRPTPIPASQLGDVLEIKYVGHYISILDAIALNLGVLHNQKINIATHYAGVTHFSISGDGLGDQGSVHMGLLGGPSHAPDWSRLDTLHFDDIQQNDQSAAFLCQQKCNLQLHNVYWDGNSIQSFAKGSSLQGVKATGVFAIEGVNEHFSCVWVVASDQEEAVEIATKDFGNCKPILGHTIPFVLLCDVQRYILRGGALPFSNADVWANDWEL